MYNFVYHTNFENKADKLVRQDSLLKKKLEKALKLLSDNPLYPSLRTHKVDSKEFTDVWSSWVTGDIRIIWKYSHDQILIIILLDIGSHSGNRRVYK
jgi:mRNA-degrading endonuclease YafQ of YafQ-DinJ toxin-antitoxin module